MSECALTYNELLCLTFIAHCEKNSNYDPLTTKSKSFFAHSNPSSHSTFKSIALTYNTWEIQPSSTKEYPKYIGHFLLEFLIRR